MALAYDSRLALRRAAGRGGEADRMAAPSRRPAICRAVRARLVRRDGFHPNARAHALWGEEIAALALPLLADGDQPPSCLQGQTPVTLRQKPVTQRLTPAAQDR
jgi:hypothetical protein